MKLRVVRKKYEISDQIKSRVKRKYKKTNKNYWSKNKLEKRTKRKQTRKVYKNTAIKKAKKRKLTAKRHNLAKKTKFALSEKIPFPY